MPIAQCTSPRASIIARGRYALAVAHSTPPSCDVDGLTKAARLARLELPPERLGAMCDDLSRIIAHIDSMQALDLAGVEPLAHPLDATGALAPDEPADPLPAQALLDLAPETHPPYITVPKVIGGDAGASA